jgi:hypothetical protein
MFNHKKTGKKSSNSKNAKKIYSPKAAEEAKDDFLEEGSIEESQVPKSKDNLTEFESTSEMSFFCTQDKTLKNYDNAEVISFIVSKFPGMKDSNPDPMIKKSMLEMFDSKDFINELLEYYNITIYDLFKILYDIYSSVFRGQFIKKIKNKMRYRDYAKITRQKRYY